MYKRIDFSNLGGNPLDQQSIDLMQSSYNDTFGAIAAMIGDKVIVSGVVVNPANNTVSNGWITYNWELIPFIGGNIGAGVVVQEVVNYSPLFEDGNTHDVEFIKTASIGSPSTFDFSDLVPLTTLINIWLPGDVKEKVCDDAYIAANYDADGFGLGKEKGWRIMSKVYPPSAGAVFVNRNPDDPDFTPVGKYAGEKTHTLDINEMPSHSHSIPRGDSYSGHGTDIPNVTGQGQQENPDPDSETGSVGGGAAHNNLQPYFVILKLIKL